MRIAKNTVCVLHEGEARLKVMPDRGGMITHWQLGDQDLLYMDAERFADETLSVRGGVPILFPICGNLPNNEFTHQEQTYSLKQHGFARDQAWELKVQTSNALTVMLSDTPETLGQFPFPFHLEVTYTLTADTVTIQIQLENTGTEPLPFSFGFHPYFLATSKPDLTLDIPASRVTDQKTQIESDFSGQMDWAAPELDLAFSPLTQPIVKLQNQATQQELTLEFSPDFAVFVFWTLVDKDYVCLEPWTAPRNALNTGNNLLTVAPTEAWQGEVKLTVSSLS